jgi:catechol 2,3-dioxygenase-like lactoylglutathione lyase family enzyme
MHESGPTRGVHHVGLTVPDLAAARRFFVEELGYAVRAEKPEYPAVFLSDGTTLITLWQASDPEHAVPFDRHRNVGLHHVAIAVDGHSALHALHERLVHAGRATIEFAPEPLGNGPARHMMLRIPGGIRLEVIAPGA